MSVKNVCVSPGSPDDLPICALWPPFFYRPSTIWELPRCCPNYVVLGLLAPFIRGLSLWGSNSGERVLVHCEFIRFTHQRYFCRLHSIMSSDVLFHRRADVSYLRVYTCKVWCGFVTISRSSVLFDARVQTAVFTRALHAPRRKSCCKVLEVEVAYIPSSTVCSPLLMSFHALKDLADHTLKPMILGSASSRFPLIMERPYNPHYQTSSLTAAVNMCSQNSLTLPGDFAL